MVEKIGAGHKSDVTYPSEDNMKVKIIIPAELFKTRGRGKELDIKFPYYNILLHVRVSGFGIRKTLPCRNKNSGLWNTE